MSDDLLAVVQQKANAMRRATIRLHGLAPETRLASSLSDVEILSCLYYGGVLRFAPHNPAWEERDRLIVSKGHGGISLYPILADLGFFDPQMLETIGQPGTIFGSIPDCGIPGFETINGALGHGLGVGVGMALGLRVKKNPASVFVLTGDGELYEGAIWEAVMFAGHHQLDNLILIVDYNKISMLDFCKNTIDLEPLEQKLASFGWDVQRIDGHNLVELLPCLHDLKQRQGKRPKALIADTVKGKGVPQLEGHPLCHVKSLSASEVADLLKEPL